MVISQSCRSALVVTVDGRSALRVRQAALGIGTADGRTEGCVGRVRVAGAVAVMTGGRLCGLERRQLAVCVALRQDFDGEVRAVALAQTATNAIRGLDDGVVRQQEAVLGADLDTNVAALAPLVDPSDIDEVNDSGGASGFTF